MKQRCIYLLVFLSIIQFAPRAEEKSLEDQIADAKEQLEQEKITNVELKAQLAAREAEAGTLRQKLGEIEGKIAALKKENGLD